MLEILEGPFPGHPFSHAKSGLYLPTIPVRVAKPSNWTRCFEAWAMIDTGSGGFLIDPPLAKMLDLEVTDTGTTQTIHGSQSTRLYSVSFSADRGRAFSESVIAASASTLSQGVGMILGMGWLDKKRFVYDGVARTFRVSWDLPEPSGGDPAATPPITKSR